MKYSGPPRTAIKWPPKQTKEEGGTALRNGEPHLMPLKRYSNNKALSTDWWCACCACGFRHLTTFDVIRSPDGDWWLSARAYGDDKTRPRKVKRAKK